ncbi:MAG: hypothetical protein O2971_16790 [Proteobacteria bacterium]|nr:hypothetical protein [Pseudomonadota bacterium]
MLGLLKKSPKRIMLINSEGLSVFILESDRLMHVGKFSDEDSDHENFRAYLADSAPSPVTLLVDSVAEDFLIETIPHVSRFDRASFLRRKTTQHFRGADYRSASLLSRESSGRKDDRVLFSALTKNSIVDHWVRVLLQEEIPIKCVTSPAYALCKIAEEYELMTSEKILLANWEASGIRQTFIVKGMMMFSRLTPSPTGPDVNLAEAIIEACEQTRGYLERVELIEFEEALDVHIITPQLEQLDFARFLKHRSLSSIMHHNSMDMLQIDRYGGSQSSITAVLLCLDWGVRKGLLANRYAPSAALRFYHLRRARTAIGLAALSIAVAGGLIALPIILDVADHRTRIQQLTQDVVPIQTLYDELTAQFPETPIPSEAMQLAVSNFNLIDSQIRNPISILSEISQVLAGHPSIVLTTIDWNLGPEEEDISFTQAILNNAAVVNVQLVGTLIGSRSIQNSSTLLSRFMDALDQIEGATVSAIKLPIESGPEAQVITVINDEIDNAEFALNVQVGS